MGSDCFDSVSYDRLLHFPVSPCLLGSLWGSERHGSLTRQSHGVVLSDHFGPCPNYARALSPRCPSYSTRPFPLSRCSTFGLAYALWTGKGVHRDVARARALFHDAAVRGVGPAMSYKAMATAVLDPPSADRDAIVQRYLSRGVATQVRTAALPSPPLPTPPATSNRVSRQPLAQLHSLLFLPLHSFTLQR